MLAGVSVLLLSLKVVFAHEDDLVCAVSLELPPWAQLH